MKKFDKGFACSVVPMQLKNLLRIGKSASLVPCICFLFACSAQQKEVSTADELTNKPNIVFFFVDDMGWQESSVPFYEEVTELNQRYHTPNMEVLAREGMKFTRAYAYALCSPSRVSLMTGMNAARHQVTNWTLRKDTSPDPEHPAIMPPLWNVNGLSNTAGVEHTIVAKTLPMYLKEVGYTTIHVGKAHFGAKETPGDNPLNLGFDVNIAGHAAGGPGSYHGDKNFSAVWRDGDKVWDVPGLEKYHGQKINLTEALTREAKQAIKVAVNEQKPFYLYMSHYAVHAPWEEDRRFYQKYLDQGLDEFSAMRASMIESMDKSLGDIMAKIDELGIEENTIVVFMSDNGAPKQVALNKPLRGHKLTPYEGGVRVPMIVKWPGVSQAGTVCNEYVMIEDVFPSFLEMAGVPEVQYRSTSLDGISWVPLVKGEISDGADRPIFWHFPHTYDQFPYSAIRKGDWKLVYHHIDQHLELFNLEEDIGEENDLSLEEPKIRNELATILSNFLKEVNAGMSIDKETGSSVPYPSE